MAKINVLPKEVYELIAAGEVIERPASIVKELIENSIDAGADSITVEIKNGGRTFIRVTDNGSGIPYEQVPTAFMRHATSKVSEKDDLNKIMTLGFRGEALASVCAVAKVEILTKTPDADLGTRYKIAAGEEKTYEQAGCPEGTSVMVRDLFYNVPARLKFLKKDATEGNRIQELMSRLAVSHPDISIKLIRDNKPVFVTAGDGKLYSAIYAIFGREFANSLMPAEYVRDGVTVTGYICKPLSSKPNRKFQVFYVNDRYVRSEVCSQALEEAYKNSIMVGKFPMCVLKLNISPSMIDVNVHPAKTEVRFSDNRYVYDAVYFAVKQGLEQNDRPYELKIEHKLHFDKDKLYVDNTPPPEQMVFADPARAEQRERSVAETEKKISQAGDDLFLKSLETPPENPLWNGVLAPAPVEDIPPEQEEEAPQVQEMPAPEHTSAEETLEDESFSQLCREYDIKDSRTRHEDDPAMEEPDSFKETDEIDTAEMPLENFEFVTADDFRRPARVPSPVEDEVGPEKYVKPVVIGELFKTYIVAQCDDKMVLIDKHAAHERHIYESIRCDARNLTAQTLLEPIMVMLPYDEYDAVCRDIEKIEKLGFIIEPDVAPTIAVKALPTILRDQNPTDIICEIAQRLAENANDPAPKLFDHVYATMACKAAIKAHDDNRIEELQKLAELVYEEDLRYCPHGRPVKIETAERELEKQFRRIV